MPAHDPFPSPTSHGKSFDLSTGPRRATAAIATFRQAIACKAAYNSQGPTVAVRETETTISSTLRSSLGDAPGAGAPGRAAGQGEGMGRPPSSGCGAQVTDVSLASVKPPRRAAARQAPRDKASRAGVCDGEGPEWGRTAHSSVFRRSLL